MEVQETVKFPSGIYSVNLIEPDICPRCKHAIQPVKLHIHGYEDATRHHYVAGLYLCKNCYEAFMTLTRLYGNAYCFSEAGEQLFCGPAVYEGKEFPVQIETLSPRFVEIYNQALAAEDAGLDQICGIGYRKALEFLIKDYLIHKEPDAREDIEVMSLSNCIKQKVDNDDLKVVAERRAWLGNDEAHFYRKHEEYSLDDLKRLLDAAVYWVSMKLTTEFALEIEKKS